MMISPEGYIGNYKNKPYKELLTVRDKLLEKIRAFKEHTYNPELDMIHPSPEVVYQCNLEYLGRLCELIAEKYNQEYVWEDTADESYLEVIRDYLKAKGLGYNTSLILNGNAILGKEKSKNDKIQVNKKTQVKK